MPLLAIELIAAAFDVLGTVMLALNGPRAGLGFLAYLGSNAGWLIFAWLQQHWGLFGQQIAFTASSILGMWIWLIKPKLWGEWRGDFEGNATLFITTLARITGRRVDAHKMVAPDMPGCYHTHPARAFRIVVWGGYIEQMEDGTTKAWRPGMMGLVRPELSHRIDALINGRCSYSLWLRGRKTHPITLPGLGWRAHWLTRCAGRFVKAGHTVQDAADLAVTEFLIQCHEEPFSTSAQLPVNQWPDAVEAAEDVLREWAAEAD